MNNSQAINLKVLNLISKKRVTGQFYTNMVNDTPSDGLEKSLILKKDNHYNFIYGFYGISLAMSEERSVTIELNQALDLAIALSAQEVCPLSGLGSTNIEIDPNS